MYPDDTVKIASDGTGLLKGDKKLDEGMYILYLPDGKYFDLLIGKDQKFSIETDTANFIQNAKIEGCADNEIFFGFQKYITAKTKVINELQETLKTTEKEKDKEKIRKQLKQIDDERKGKIRGIIEKNPDLFVSVFLNATLDIEVPEAPKDEDGNLVDSAWSYKYYRNHYFDNFDYTDARLLRTPLYENKLMNYMNKVIPQIPDTIIAEVDKIILNVEQDSALFRYVLITLFNHYGKSKIMGMESVQVFIAEKHYIDKAWWSADKYIEDLKERVKAMKPTLLGNIAPDIQLRFVPSDHFKKALQVDSLRSYPHAGMFFNISDIKSDYTVLVFWEATCSHCKTAVPELHQLYQDSLSHMGVKIIAISTLFNEDGKEKWTDFVNEHELYEWINAWNPYDYQYKLTYDIRSTPQIFILNKEKEIIAKRIGEDQILEVIEAHRKYNN